MPSRCEFFFDRPDAVYYSGDTLNGKIVLTTDKVKSVRGIYITIKGEAKVRWSESRSRQRDNKTEHYTVYYKGDQQYLNSRVQVEGEMDLPPGVHEYTFSTPLPPQIPCSISGEYGHVSYEVELKLDRPFRTDNKYANLFTVIRTLNLNADPSYKQPLVLEAEKFFCCCCCGSGSMKSELRTEFSGFAPGQKINFTLVIDNESNNDIEACIVKLIQTIAFKSQTPETKVKNVKNVIGEVVVDGAIRFTKKLHQGDIRVPALPPSTTNPSDIISVNYVLKAEIECGFCSINEDMHSNIFIGTVPILESATNPNSVITVQPTAPTTGDESDDDKPPQYGSFVPPSFEEATGMNQPFVDPEADEDRVHNPYVPKYPVYHNFANPSAPDEEQRHLLSGFQPSSWQLPPVIPGTARSIGEQSERVPPPNLPYPVHPSPAMPAVPDLNPPTEKGAAPNIGWHL